MNIQQKQLIQMNVQEYTITTESIEDSTADSTDVTADTTDITADVL